MLEKIYKGFASLPVAFLILVLLLIIFIGVVPSAMIEAFFIKAFFIVVLVRVRILLIVWEYSRVGGRQRAVAGHHTRPVHLSKGETI